MQLSFRPLALEQCQKATVLKRAALQEFSGVTYQQRAAIKLTGEKCREQISKSPFEN